MKITKYFILLFIVFLTLVQCKKEAENTTKISSENSVKYAKGFSIENYDGYTIITVKNPWPKASKTYQYLLKEKDGIVPDSLNKLIKVNVPIKNIVVTSTTHIPSLEMLNEENSLIGFPNLNYIS